MRRELLAIGAGVALATAGCGDKTSKNAEKTPAGPPPPPAVTQTQPNKQSKPEINIPHEAYDVSDLKDRMKADPMFNSLVQFRQKILTRRQAKVMVGACIAWGNTSGGITVVLNPGQQTFKDGENTVDYPVFTRLSEPNDPSSLLQMNGPVTVTDPEGKILQDEAGDNLALELYKKDGRVSLQDRPISDQPIQDSQGRVYFKDARTHEPLMLTGLAPVPISEQNVADACDALRHHTALPGTKTIQQPILLDDEPLVLSLYASQRLP